MWLTGERQIGQGMWEWRTARAGKRLLGRGHRSPRTVHRGELGPGLIAGSCPNSVTVGQGQVTSPPGCVLPEIRWNCGGRV